MLLARSSVADIVLERISTFLCNRHRRLASLFARLALHSSLIVAFLVTIHLRDQTRGILSPLTAFLGTLERRYALINEFAVLSMFNVWGIATLIALARDLYGASCSQQCQHYYSRNQCAAAP